MKREDLIAAARILARIDAVDEEGNMADDQAVLDGINALADENDRLESELASSRKLYADAFFNQPTEEGETGDTPASEEEIKIEDFLDI